MPYYVNPQEVYLLMFFHKELLERQMELQAKRRMKAGLSSGERAGDPDRAHKYFGRRLVFKKIRDFAQRGGVSSP